MAENEDRMKLKNITILYTLFLAVCFFTGLFFYRQNLVVSSDITELHKNITEIQKLYQNGTPVEALEADYKCQILLCNDDEYVKAFWDAVDKKATILDIVSDTNPSQIIGKVIYYQQQDKYTQLTRQLWRTIALLSILISLAGYFLILLVYLNILRPFHKLESFAGNVAKGNLELPLPMDKTHLFGSFTESFDLMREELKLAREREFKANQSKKELVAELSHDIKTPIATIRANCELITVTTKEALTSQKLVVIDEKASTVEKLVDNLFHATLEELQVLKVNPLEESSEIISNLLADLKSYTEVHLHGAIPRCLIWIDVLRFSQVLDNIIYNSFKYAGTDIDVTFSDLSDGILIRIADHGPGIDDAELPLITEKFFRGSNSAGKSGSGLGLFLAKSFMEQMKGAMNYYNDNGFVVELFLHRV